jgi:hypothetical protein
VGSGRNRLSALLRLAHSFSRGKGGADISLSSTNFYRAALARDIRNGRGTEAIFRGSPENASGDVRNLLRSGLRVGAASTRPGPGARAVRNGEARLRKRAIDHYAAEMDWMADVAVFEVAF